MKIHHISIPAHDPDRVARVLAELLGGRVIPMPHPHGSLLVYAGDGDGTAIEVWPATLRGVVGRHELAPRADLPLPEGWPHHAFITSEACEPAQILAVFRREGWIAEHVHNGPPEGGFSLVRGWLENHSSIEIGGRAMRDQYEQFFRDVVKRAAA